MNETVTYQALGLKVALRGVLGREAASTEEAAANAVSAYLEAQSVIAQMEGIKEEAKLKMTEIMAETGKEDWSFPNGSVRVNAPSARVSWDARALDVLCESDPGLGVRLYPFRKATAVAGAMVISARGAQKEKVDG